MEKVLENKLIKLKDLDGIHVITLDLIMKKEFSPDTWLIDRLVPEQSITAITGAPASFKTWLALEATKCVAKGSEFLGKFKTTQGGVLIVDKENHFRHIQKRWKLLGFEDLPIYYFAHPDEFLIDKEKDYESLIRVIEDLDIKLVIFDSLVRMHSGDENESKHINKVMGAFRKITNIKNKNITVIFIHHNRKEGERKHSTTNSVRGSSDILAGIDCLLQVIKPQKENYLGVTQSKLRQDKEIEPFKVDICSNEENSSMEFKYGGLFNSNEPELEEVKESILEILKEKDEISRPEFIEILSESYSTPIIDSALKELIKSEVSKIRKGERGKNFYSLKEKVIEF